jgi:glycosyltransferase involved in cell wall biosynthesis
MKKAIIIPIYLKFKQPEELPHLEGLRLAKRAIESLKRLEDQDFALILPLCFDLTGEIKEDPFPEMTRVVIDEVKRLRREETLVFSTHHLRNLRDYLNQLNFKYFSSLIDLKGFSRIRNTGLLLAQGLSIDAAIFIDSDEVIEDPQYLKIACEHLNEKWKDKVVHGKGGFYVNRDGTILLPPQRFWWRFLWNKTKWMNQVWENILSAEDRLVPSPFLLGGNLVLHQSLFRHIPFDPYIPRGEDTDYLINASQTGFCLLFDREMKIKHLHPERTGVFFQEELRGDIERFLYERRKTKEGSQINLDPYPGYFLRWSVFPKAGVTSIFLGLDYLAKGEWNKARECIANIGLLFQEEQDGWLKYRRFKEDWEKATDILGKEGMDGVLEGCRV